MGYLETFWLCKDQALLVDWRVLSTSGNDAAHWARSGSTQGFQKENSLMFSEEIGFVFSVGRSGEAGVSRGRNGLKVDR